MTPFDLLWFLLPVAAASLWVGRDATPRQWAWLGGWVVVFGLCAFPEFGAFDRLGHVVFRCQGLADFFGDLADL